MAQNRNTGDKRKIELLTNTYSIQNNITQKREADSQTHHAVSFLSQKQNICIVS